MVADDVATQQEVDALVAGVRPSRALALPKGMSEELFAKVTRAIRAGGALSASELGDQVGVSRVTARRYAEHLCDARLVERAQRYAGAGRPEIEYRWVG